MIAKMIQGKILRLAETGTARLGQRLLATLVPAPYARIRQAFKPRDQICPWGSRADLTENCAVPVSQLDIRHRLGSLTSILIERMSVE
jgi:hypothetical protein